MTKKFNAAEQRRQSRLARLPAIMRETLSDPTLAAATLTMAPYTRAAMAQGLLITIPTMPLEVFDAHLALLADAAGQRALTDHEFEYCLRAITPPEHRGSDQ
jgi:hypothetical protein